MALTNEPPAVVTDNDLTFIRAIKSQSWELLDIKQRIDSREQELKDLRNRIVTVDAERNDLWRKFYEIYRDLVHRTSDNSALALVEINERLRAENEALHNARR